MGLNGGDSPDLYILCNYCILYDPCDPCGPCGCWKTGLADPDLADLDSTGHCNSGFENSGLDNPGVDMFDVQKAGPDSPELGSSGLDPEQPVQS